MSDFVDVDVVATAMGLGRIQLRNDIRAGKFPGVIRGSKTIIPRALYEQYLRGEWQPAPKREPVGLHPVGRTRRAT